MTREISTFLLNNFVKFRELIQVTPDYIKSLIRISAAGLILTMSAGCGIMDYATNHGTGTSDSGASDLEAQLAAAGYTLPSAPVQGVSSFTISDPMSSFELSPEEYRRKELKYGKEAMSSYTISGQNGISTRLRIANADLSGSRQGSTASGDVTFTATIDNATTSMGSIEINIWRNGEEIPYSYSAGISSGTIVLTPGDNYLVVCVYVNGSLYGISPVMMITSSIPSAPIRIELSWDGPGDVDLHLDDGATGRHVYYGYRTYNDGIFNMDLDVDNVIGYGPENIRVYEAPAGSSFRCFVNYYSGSSDLTATVKIYQSEVLDSTVTIPLVSLLDSGAGSTYNSKSKNCGTITGGVATPATCGDGLCNGSETNATCSADCSGVATCNYDGICDASETSTSCSSDCGSSTYCGDGICNGSETSYTCYTDCSTCNYNGVCDAAETSTTCSFDCAPTSYCGDGTCNGTETSTSCSLDCGISSYCGDGVCDVNGGENAGYCSSDCNVSNINNLFATSDDLINYSYSAPYIAAYYFSCSAGVQYTAMWNDSFSGNYTQTEDIAVQILDGAGTNMLSLWADSGYYTPRSFTPVTGGLCNINVSAYGSSGGLFAGSGTYQIWVTTP